MFGSLSCVQVKTVCSGHCYVFRSLFVCSVYSYVFKSLMCAEVTVTCQVTTMCSGTAVLSGTAVFSGNHNVFRLATVVCTQIAAQCVSRSLLCVQVMAMLRELC